jgi:hypothetical protein
MAEILKEAYTPSGTSFHGLIRIPIILPFSLKSSVIADKSCPPVEVNLNILF